MYSEYLKGREEGTKEVSQVVLKTNDRLLDMVAVGQSPGVCLFTWFCIQLHVMFDFFSITDHNHMKQLYQGRAILIAVKLILTLDIFSTVYVHLH